MFTTVAAIAFAAMATIWNRRGWLNTLLKLTFVALAVWGGIEALMAWGFILAPQTT